MKNKKIEIDEADEKGPVQFPSFAYTIEELMQVAALGRTYIYEAIQSGDLVARKAGRRTIVLHADYEAFLSKLPAIVPVDRAPVDGEVA